MTSHIRRSLLLSFALTALSTLSACGGGGDSEVTNDAVSGSHWRVDDRVYRRGTSQQEPLDPSGLIGLRRGAIVHVATVPGPAETGLGVGSINAQTSSDAAGVYEVVPDIEALVRRGAVGDKVIIVESTQLLAAGGGTLAGVIYVATSGTVEVSKDAAGQLHLTTSAPLPAVPSPFGPALPANAPASVRLSLMDAY